MIWWMRQRLEGVADQLGLPIADIGWDRLAELQTLWLRYGRAMSLIGAGAEAELVPHVVDALATVACATRGRALTSDVAWIDVGSGGGLPGLVVAALTPCRLTLVEPRQKRAGFLALASRAIGRDVAISRGRIEGSTWNENGLSREISAEYHVASSRAAFPVGVWITLGEKLVIDGGEVIAHLRIAGQPPRKSAISRIVDAGRARICAYSAIGLREK